MRLLVSVFLLGLVVGCDHDRHSSITDPSMVIGDIRGDRLGMSRQEYAKSHPGSCGDSGPCVGQDTYAGVSALKDAEFTDDGKLWQIHYAVDDIFSDQILAAIKEKYRDLPGCRNVDGITCTWSNGNAEIRFSNTGKYANLDFNDVALTKQVVDAYARKQAEKRKSDQ